MAMKYNPLSGEFDYTVDVAQTLGDSADKAISQKVFSAKINEIKDAMGEIPEFSSVVEGKISYNNTSPVSGTAGDIIYSLEHNMFLYRDSSGTYYKGWSNVSDYMDGDTPKNGTYKCGGQLYVYKDGSLQISQSGGAGLESVENLPYDNLYEGRAVTCKGRVYVYHNDEWTSIADDLGHRPETHPEEFLYQPTASDLSVKDGFSKIQSIKGNTIVWNQLCSIKGELSVTGQANQTIKYIRQQELSVAANHRLLIILDAKSDGITESPVRLFTSYNNGAAGTNVISHQTFIGNGEYNRMFSLVSNPNGFKNIILYYSTGAEEVTFYYKNFQIFDLTLMFGEGNEPATVEEFEAIFPAPYYEYNAGELLSHDSTGIKTVGFNQWDEEWENGYISSDGNLNQGGAWRCKNPIKVIPNTTYYFKSIKPLFLYWYDGDYKLIGTGVNSATNNRLHTSPANARYLRFYEYQGTNYNNDICINLSHSGYRNGEYQPYEDYVTQWAEGKKISELTSNGVVVFPHGLMSAGDVYDEITKDSAGKSIAIKRCEADTVNLTTTALEAPVTYVLDNDLNLSYKVWDFGTEEILAENLALPFKGDIEYGFNAVDMIRNNYFAIKEIKEKLLPSIIHQQLPKDDSQCLPGNDILIWSVFVPAKSELHARVTVKMYDSPSEGSMLALGIKNTDNVCLAASCAPLPTVPDVGHTVNITHWFEEETRCIVFIRTTDVCYLTDKCPVGDDIVGASELIIKTFGE